MIPLYKVKENHRALTAFLFTLLDFLAYLRVPPTVKKL